MIRDAGETTPVEAVKSEIEHVQKLSVDNPRQQARIPELIARFEKLSEAWSHTAAERMKPGVTAEQLAGEQRRTALALAALDDDFQRMDEEERRLLTARERETERAYAIARSTTILAGALGLATVALLVWVLGRFLRSQRDAAAAVDDQRRLLQATLISVGDGVIATDPVGCVTFLNPVAEQLTGWSTADAAGVPLDKVFNIVNESTRVPVENPALRATKEGTVVGLANHTILIARDGTERPIDDSAAPIRNSNGEVVGAVLVFRDASDKRTAETALRASEERLSLAVDTAALGLWDWDVRTGDVLWNAHHERIFGYTPGQPHRTYQDFASRLPPEDLKRLEEGFRLAQQDCREYRFQHRVVWPDGTNRWVEAVGRFHCDEDGRPIRSVGVLVDVTERKRAEQELQRAVEDLKRAEEALREADRRKDEFLATLAHELRNPLAPIRNGLQLLRIAGREPDAIAKARVVMERQLTQLVRLVDDLLDISRISQGKLELRREPVLLANVVASAVETSRPLIDQMGHTLTVALPEQPVVLDADFTRFAQVVMNLLNNAAKYTRQGGRIWLTGVLRGAELELSVRDTGIGIAADQLPRIFKMFSQLEPSLERSQGGLGIGLTLVKRLVEMHGGRVWAASEGPGKGSEFTVRVPARIEPAPSKHSERKDEAEVTTSLSILIVDDNRDSADSLAMILQLLGNETHTAYDGEEGVEAAAKFRPNVIFLDIGLPKLNGYEACRRIRQQPWGKQVVIIAQTGWGQEDDRQRTREAGFDHHLVKPIDTNNVMKLLADVQNGKRASG